MQVENSKRQYNSIDLFKFICSILVVMIHVKPLGNAISGSLLDYCNFGIKNYLARIAVPFFFVSSGFLLYRKTSYDNFSASDSKKYIFRMIRLYLIWTLIYFPISFRGFFYDENGIFHACILYLRNLIFAGSYRQLWYLPALAFAVGLISFLLKNGIKPRTIAIIAFAFYIIGLLGQSWFGLIVPLRENTPVLWNILRIGRKIIYSTRDGLFEAFFFVSLGMLFAFNNNLKIRSKTSLLFFILSMIAMGIEIFVLQNAGFIRENDMYFFLVPVTFFFFSYILELQLPDNPIYKTLRLMSTLVFFLHLWVDLVVYKLLSVVYRPLSDTCIQFVLTLIFTIIISYVVIKLSNNCKRLKWLKVLYT